jgi:hypothetical protein
MKLKPITWAAAICLTGMVMTDTRGEELPPKPLKVLLVGNSQCPAILANRLIENLAASDKGGRPIKVSGCIKGGASLRSHWEAGTGPETGRGMISSGKWDFVVLQDIYNVKEPAFRPFARRFHLSFQPA